MNLMTVNPPTGYTRPQNEPHTEFPKYVHILGKPSVIVQDADEEAAVLAGSVPEPKLPELAAPAAPIVSLVGENDEMEMLKKVAEQRGIHIDGRWKIAKVRAAVTAAMPLPSE